MTAERLRAVCEVARRWTVVSAAGLTVRAVEDVALQLKELLFPAIADIAVLSVDGDIESVRLDAQCTMAGAACPGCGVCSTRVHSSYLRRQMFGRAALTSCVEESCWRDVLDRLLVHIDFGGHASKQQL